MLDLLIAILLVIAMAAIAAMVFGGWVIYTLLRAVFGVIRVLGRALGLGGHRPPEGFVTAQQVGGVVCPRSQCRAENRPEARFCHRCGQELPRPRRVSVRRAAML